MSSALPIEFLHIERHKVFARSGRDFRTAFDLELSKSFRYGKSSLGDWEGYFRVATGPQEFYITTYINLSFVRRTPTMFPAFDPDLWGKGLQIKEHHMVAIFRLSTEMPHLLMSPRTWLDFKGKDEAFPAIFNKRYRLWSPSGQIPSAALFPTSLLAVIGAQPKLRIEWVGALLFIEYPYVLGIGTGKQQFEPFADFCIQVMSSSPDLFEVE